MELKYRSCWTLTCEHLDDGTYMLNVLLCANTPPIQTYIFATLQELESFVEDFDTLFYQ